MPIVVPQLPRHDPSEDALELVEEPLKPPILPPPLAPPPNGIEVMSGGNKRMMVY